MLGVMFGMMVMLSGVVVLTQSNSLGKLLLGSEPEKSEEDKF